MTIKKVVLAFLWLLSLLVAVDLTATFTNSPAWVWETKPWVRRIKHWPEPVVAVVGDTPIYQSDFRNAFDGLVPHAQDNERKMKASDALLNMTVYSIFLRDAAQSYGIFQSAKPSQRLENFKYSILKTLIDEQIFARQAVPTETQIRSFIAQNPNTYTQRLIHYREDRYRGPISKKLSRRKLVSTRHESFTYPGPLNPPTLAKLLTLPSGQSSALFACGTDFCRYTKEGKDLVEPTFDTNRAMQIAKSQIMARNEADLMNAYRKSHPIKIERQDLIDNILR